MTINYSFKILESVLMVKKYNSREEVLSTCENVVKIINEVGNISENMKASYAEARKRLFALSYEEMNEIIDILKSYDEDQCNENKIPEPYDDGTIDYENGINCYRQEDYKGAFVFFQNASRKGHAKAHYNCGVCLYNGIGTRQNRAEAMKKFVRASDEGLEQANAMIDYIMNRR